MTFTIVLSDYLYYMKNDNPRVIAARIRQGDYAHPGGECLIDTFLSHLIPYQNLQSTKILDIGCWRGGTAHYIQKKYPQIQSISGIDLDKEVVHYANTTYSDIDFTVWDINHIHQLNKKYHLLYLFNVYYILPELSQKACLFKFTKIAEKNAILAISDYTVLQQDNNVLTDALFSPMNPISLEKLPQWLFEAGWEIIEVVDLQTQYTQWYLEFLEQLHHQKESLLTDFTERSVSILESTFQKIADKLTHKIWGGSIIYARLL